MSDEELINRIHQGNEAAAKELIHRYYPSIFRYCHYRCGSKETAEDLTQETFLRLFEALPRYKEEGKFKSYIFSIAHRLCINGSKETPTAPLEEAEQVEDKSDMIRQVEDRDEIHHLLDRLPPGQREAIVLRFGERLSFPDLARATGSNLRTAQSRVRLALEKMRKEISHER